MYLARFFATGECKDDEHAQLKVLTVGTFRILPFLERKFTRQRAGGMEIVWLALVAFTRLSHTYTELTQEEYSPIITELKSSPPLAQVLHLFSPQIQSLIFWKWQKNVPSHFESLRYTLPKIEV